MMKCSLQGAAVFSLQSGFAVGKSLQVNTGLSNLLFSFSEVGQRRPFYVHWHATACFKGT